MVEHGRAIATGAAGAQRVEQHLPEGWVVVRVEEEAFRRITSKPVPEHLGVVEAVHRSPDRPPAAGLQLPGELVRERGLPGAVHTVHAHARDAVLWQRRDAAGHGTE